MAETENDAESRAEVEAELGKLTKAIGELEVQTLLSGKYDSREALVTIRSEAGGVDAADFAEMLMRMYLRWAERRGFQVEMKEASPGEEAGLKSATFVARGENAYGLFAAERGVHRLVRISPFDSSSRRHTSFAQVDVGPIVDEDVAVEIDDGDLRVDTYRASGAGGQHVNKTDSAIRITHLPTNIVVQCQSDRSQHRNRAEAMAMLKSRLYEVELRKREAEKQKMEDSKTDIGWGHQIRNYILDQSIIKDLRTNYEVGNTRGVLDGDLDDFIAASLKQGV